MKADIQGGSTLKAEHLPNVERRHLDISSKDTQYLLLRPTPQEGESWIGFLLRLSNANGYFGFEAIAKRLHYPVKRLIAFPQWECLSALGIDIKQRKSEAPDLTNIRRFRENAWTTKGSRSRVCPSCLQEMLVPCILAVWERRQFSACQKHGNLLVDECDRCHRSINYSRKRWDRCECGLNYRDIKALEKPKWFEAFNHALSSNLLESSDAQNPNSIANLQAALVTETLVSLKREGRIPGRGLRPKFGTQKQLAELDTWFGNWPSSFISALSQHVDLDDVAAKAKAHRWLKTKKFPVLKALLNGESNSFSSEREISRKPFAYKHEEMVTPNRFCKVSGLGYQVVKNLIRNDVLPVIRSLPDSMGRRFQYIDAKHLDRACLLLQETISRKQAADFLKCPEHLLTLLARNGRLPLSFLFEDYLLPGHMRFRQADLKIFLESLKSISSYPSRKNLQLVTLSDLLHKVGRSKLLRVINAIDQRSLSLYSRTDLCNSLASLYICSHQLTASFDWWKVLPSPSWNEDE